MRIIYVVERFMPEIGAVEVRCWPESKRSITETLIVPLESDGKVPESREAVLARVEAALPIAKLEERVRKDDAPAQDVTHVYQEVGKQYVAEMQAADQGRLRVSTLGQQVQAQEDELAKP